jgi:hypothetical protein
MFSPSSNGANGCHHPREPVLRSLDALHLASAEHLVARTGTALTGFVAYDETLLRAAEHLDLPVVSPGTDRAAGGVGA